MATLTMTPPSRQPFASLDTPRMRTLMRSKLNRQNQLNGAAFPSKCSISTNTNTDTENIDPATLCLSTKRKRSFDDDDNTSKGSPKPIKSSRMTLANRDVNVPPRLSTPLKAALATPKSVPLLKPAGRSPPPKSCKAFSRRSTIAKPRLELSKRGVARPFSLATALSQSKAPKPQPKAQASWFFDIHVDTEQEEMTNLMQHSTGVLDISDDEGKASSIDGRGKENVPPTELGIDLVPSRHTSSLAATAATHKASKMEKDRSPLAELNAPDYYPEDCHAFSYAVVYDDEQADISESKKTSIPSLPTESTFIHPGITASIASVLKAVSRQPIVNIDDSSFFPKVDVKDGAKSP